MGKKLSAAVVTLCREKLIEKKSEILNRIKENFQDYQTRDRGGDEADQVLDVLAEDQFLRNQDRLRHLLLEIEIALAKIEKGIYGVCEETEEFIEPDRLIALPWARLSLEGAELREDKSRRFAKS
jgi:DnaK suppressor protein